MTTATEPNIAGWLPQKPDARDRTIEQRLPDVLRLAAPVTVPSLTMDMPILDQGSLGSCTAYASGRAFRYIDKQDGQQFDVSELYQYYNSRMEMGSQYVTQDSGATIRDAVKALSKYGIADEANWPYQISRYTERPPQSAYNFGLLHEATEYVSVANDSTQMQQVIAAGYPIIIGFTVYSNYQQGFSTGTWPEPSGSVVGGHAVILTGYEPNWWYMDNSWGTSIGQQGRFRMSWNFVRDNAADFWIIKKVSGDVVPPTPDPVPPPEPDSWTHWVRFEGSLKGNLIDNHGNPWTVDLPHLTSDVP